MFVDDSNEEEYRMIQPDGMCFKVGGLGLVWFALVFSLRR